MATNLDKSEIAGTYKPAPEDLSEVRLPESLVELTEVIAENTHEAWAQRRMAEGWTYGPVRDEKTMKHPCLLPYAELSELEREYDRTTAMNAIKLIVKMGFTVEKTDS